MRYLRKFFFWLHLAVGVTAGLVIALMAATGMILAFERPVLRVMDAPAPFEQQSLAEHPLPLAELLPRLGIGPKNMPTELVLHREPMPLLEVRYGHDRTFFANPWTGELIGSPASGLHHFFSIVTNLHRRLGFGMKNALAHNVVGAADLAFLFLLLSGLYLWWPRGRGAAGVLTVPNHAPTPGCAQGFVRGMIPPSRGGDARCRSRETRHVHRFELPYLIRSTVDPIASVE